MSRKFHINKHGVPAICRATKGNCPYGGESSHFDNFDEAQEYADSKMEKEYGLFANIGNLFKRHHIAGRIEDLSKEEIRELNGRITTLTRKDGSEIRGYLFTDGEDSFKISVKRDGGRRVVDVDRSEIASLDDYERIPKTQESYEVGDTVKIVNHEDAILHSDGSVSVSTHTAHRDAHAVVVAYHEDMDRYEVEYTGIGRDKLNNYYETPLWRANQMAPKKKDLSWHAEKMFPKF